MFFGFPEFLMTPEQKKARKKRHDAWIDRCLKDIRDWDPKMKWEATLAIRASSYDIGLDPFPEVKPIHANRPQGVPEESHVDSPSGHWRYIKQILPAKTDLWTFYGSKKGHVIFDGPVTIPTLWKGRTSTDGKFYWNQHPFMSLSPMEMFTLRGGIRRAKGHVVVAGLGLGYQLLEIARKKTVRQITLVEIDEELTEWLLPRIRKLITKPLKVVVGDAYKVMPKLTADTAIVDIFPSYGNNDWEQAKLRNSCPDIGHIWCWGTAVVN